MAHWLDNILEAKRERLRRAKKTLSFSSLREGFPEKRGRRFENVLRQKDGMSIVAEIKRASPSRGFIRKDLDPVRLAQAYERGGAKAVSVLTEETFFRGSFEDLRRVKANTRLPVLCKDFIVEPYQVYEARYHGADALLLIMAILQDDQYLELHAQTLELGLTPVVEVHDHRELERALQADLEVLGVNRRNLKTLEVDRTRSEKLLAGLPQGVVKIAESGVRNKAEIQALKAIGYDACLVGETLVRAEDPEALLKSWLSPSK